jgi:predicted alpha/beta hydrolase family esterase
MKQTILFIHGGGEGAYAEDQPMAASLQTALGPTYDVQYPAMPDPDRPGIEAWKNQIARSLADMEGEVILVGHSLGASMLLKYLSEEQVDQPITGVFLMAPPYWGVEDWDVSEYLLRDDFAAKLPDGLSLFFYHSRDDEWVPFEHLALYREQLPQATIREFDDGGHQLNNDLSEVAQDIKRLYERKHG